MTAHSVTFEPVSFADLPGWAGDDHLAAFGAYCATARGVPGAAALAGRASITTAADARAFFEAQLEPSRVVYFGTERAGPSGLLTGYYEPVLDGSLECMAPFTVLILRRPADLENVVSESERSAKSEGYSHMRRTARGLEPYATREEIERGALAGRGLELLYLADPVEAFFLHVQGSGAIRLRDGRLQRITYDGKNGHPYTSIGRTLIEDGSLPADTLTLQVLGDWLRADPERGRKVLWRNASFVFFRLLEGDAPIGVLGAPLTTGRSLAVDPAYHELGSPIYVSAPSLTHAGASGGFHRLMIAQDVGSAIKGPERGDIYFGTGEAALAMAGITKHPGRFFVLRPRGAS